MGESNATSRLTVLLGVGAIVVTLLMASGRWTIFDFGIATSILCFGLYFLRTNHIAPSSRKEVILFALPFAIVTTASFIALFATVALFIPTFANIDADTYRLVNHQTQISNEQTLKIIRAQAVCQWLIFLLSFGIWVTIFYVLSPLRKTQEEEQERVAQTEA